MTVKIEVEPAAERAEIPAGEKALAVFGGSMIRDLNSWRLTRFQEKDNFGIVGGYIRTIAAALLFKEEPEALVIASGGRGQFSKIPDAPTIASLIKRDLISRGVPENRIITEERSGNTFQQLIKLQAVAAIRNFQEFKIISNRYHLPRIKAMIKTVEKLSFLKRLLDNQRLFLVSAEEVLLARQPEQWEKIINQAYQSKGMAERILLEQEGVRQLEAGEYHLVNFDDCPNLKGRGG